MRLAVCQESDADRRLAVGTVKRLTGGDASRVRRMRQDFVEFTPSHTAMLVTNHRPTVPGDDLALWRRLRVVPFEVVVDQPDTALPGRLELELPAVLAWAVRGYADWAEHGLDEPDAVILATDSYQAASDTLGRFLDERCVVDAQAHVRAGVLYAAWLTWCQLNGETPGRQNEFAEAMAHHGFAKKHQRVGRVYTGIGLAAGEEGQSRAHPLLPELRGQRALLAGLLKQMKLPDVQRGADDPAVPSATSVKARKAARSRWGNPYGAPVARERQPEPTSAGLRAWLAERDRQHAADYAAAFGDRDAPLPGLSARADALDRGELVELAGWQIPREARPAHVGPGTWSVFTRTAPSPFRVKGGSVARRRDTEHKAPPVELWAMRLRQRLIGR